jgi:hypothetical protein
MAVIDVLYKSNASDENLPHLDVMKRRLTYCCEAFQACHYRALGRELPSLMMQAQQASAQAETDAVEVHVLFSRVLQLTASFLHKYGSSTAVQAAVVADRALAAAERSGDSVAIGAAARRVAKSLTYQSHPVQAIEFAVTTANRLYGDLTAAGSLGLSTLGMLYLKAAIASSALERSTTVVRQAVGYIDHADEIADRQGPDMNADWTAFGPTNVHLHRVDVLARFEDGWSALEAAACVDEAALAELPRERRARHLITMARAYLLARRKEDAANALVEAARLAPEEVEGRKSSVHLVEDLMGVMPVPSAELRRLAVRCGLSA